MIDLNRYNPYNYNCYEIDTHLTNGDILRRNNVVVESIFMHDPIRFLAVRSSTFVENKSLSHPNSTAIAIYDLVAAGCFPKSGRGGSVSSRSRRIFFVLVAKEIPVVLWRCSYFTHLCITTKRIRKP